jgi:hypothetical protein
MLTDFSVVSDFRLHLSDLAKASSMQVVLDPESSIATIRLPTLFTLEEIEQTTV